MSVNAVTTFLSLLALLALAGAVVALVAGTGARGRGSLGVAIRRSALGLAATVGVVALAGSLYLSEGAHFLPCRLCWYQRIAMYALAVILVVAAIRRDAGVRWYALPLALGGLAISLWHLGVEHLGIGEGACELSNPCSIRWVEHFGFVTIPFMAACGFVVIAVLTAIAEPFAVDDVDDGDADDGGHDSPRAARGAGVMERSGR